MFSLKKIFLPFLKIFSVDVFLMKIPVVGNKTRG